MNFATGLFTTNRSWDIPEEIKYNKMNSYDNWLNSNNPYDKDYELEQKREYHLAEIENLDGEDEIEYYLSTHQIEDPREFNA
ncbi:hypothetical protein N9X04_00380 [bacterium]|nr:hypothetical protein [bacterium]